METTARPPAISEVPTGGDTPDGRIGPGAIASFMAVSFREEKLALGSSRDNGQPSAEAPGLRFAEAEGVA